MFKFQSFTESLLKPMENFNFDQSFFDEELVRFKSLKAIKRIKNKHKGNQFYDSIYKVSKKRLNKYKSGSLTCTNKLTDDDLSMLLESSKCVYSSDALFLSNLELSEKDFLNFFTYLSSYKKITPCLYLTNSIFSEEHIKLAFLALERYTSLVKLDLSQNVLGVEGIKSLSNSIKSYNKLIFLNLSSTFISSEGASYLKEALLCLPTLVSLNINDNQLGEEGALIISEALSSLRNLEELDINSNQLRARGTQFIMESIYILPHFCVLDICLNDIEDEGGLVICSYLKYMRTLFYLYIDFVLNKDVKDLLAFESPKYCKIISKNLENRLVIKKV